jgi:hypothetical protein
MKMSAGVKENVAMAKIINNSKMWQRNERKRKSAAAAISAINGSGISNINGSKERQPSAWRKRWRRRKRKNGGEMGERINNGDVALKAAKAAAWRANGEMSINENRQ